MERPTAQNVRTWTPQVKWSTLGYPAGTSPDALTLETAAAVNYIEWVIGRVMDATMPPQLEPLAQKAVALRVQQQVAAENEDTMEALGSGVGLRGFNVTGYSEQYADLGAAEQAQRKGRMVNPHPELNRLLWALMTPARMAWWIGFLEGGGVPSFGLVEMDWSGGNRWGGGYSRVGDGGIAGEVPGYGDAFLGDEGPLTGELPPSVVIGGDWGW